MSYYVFVMVGVIPFTEVYKRFTNSGKNTRILPIFGGKSMDRYGFSYEWRAIKRGMC
jgi:hypothetical protein